MDKTTVKTKRKILSGTKKDIIFYTALMAFPIIQFGIFYIGVNFNSLLMAFQKFDITTGESSWNLFGNFKTAFELMTKSTDLLSAAKISLLSYFIGLVIGTPLGLLFSYYIYKKLPGNTIFRILLFMPSIISAIVMVTIFQFFVERAIPEFVDMVFNIKIKGLIENRATRFPTIMFYNIWVSFGVSILMYSDAMNTISEDIVESAHLDGAHGFKEFIHITLPLVYPTLSTFLVVGVAGIFLNQMNLYSFFGGAASEFLQTYGYYLFTKTQAATSKADFPLLSAMGILLTCVAVPLTLVVRYLINKFGPSVE